VNTYASLVKLCAYLCGKYAWDPLTQVLRHFDVTGKLCPLWYVNYPEDWDVFRRDVAAEAAASDWAEEAWNWAVRKGITDGERPREYATREETAAMIWRYAASRLA
jgi:N-acetylmuramoyl-L-alanine amidase